jgi:hypothetical protein
MMQIMSFAQVDEIMMFFVSTVELFPLYHIFPP